MAESGSGRRPPRRNVQEDDVPDLPKGAIGAMRLLAGSLLPGIINYPYFGGQVATVALVVLVTWLARALSTSADVLLATAALGLVAQLSALGSLAQADGQRHQLIGAFTCLAVSTVIVAAALTMAIVLVLVRQGR
jgi:hypothetical protein